MIIFITIIIMMIIIIITVRRTDMNVICTTMRSLLHRYAYYYTLLLS